MGDQRSLADVFVDPPCVVEQQTDTAVRRAGPKHIVAFPVEGVGIAVRIVDHRMERNILVDFCPVLRIAAIQRKVGPGGMGAVQFKYAHIARRGGFSRGTNHITDGDGILAVVVPGVRDHHLVFYIDGQRIRNGGRERLGARRSRGVQRVFEVKQRGPRLRTCDAVDRQIVFFLKRLDSLDGLVQVIAADRAAEILQLGQASLYLFYAVCHARRG